VPVVDVAWKVVKMEEVRISADGQLHHYKNKATPGILYFLQYTCKLDEDVTLRSILQLIDNANLYDVLSPMLTNSPTWLKEYVDIGLGTPVEDTDEELILSWGAGVNEDYNDKNITELYDAVNIFSVKPNDPSTYSIGFTPVNEIVNCKVRQNNEYIVADDRLDTLQKQIKYKDSLPAEEQEPVELFVKLLETKKYFTLYNILYGIFWEMSFHGGPKEKVERKEELVSRIEKIDSGDEKFVSWEDIKNKLKPGE